MEKRIRAIYIISIISILTFLGMQAYWLYTRYEYSLSQYDSMAQADLSELLGAYRLSRTAALDIIGGIFINPSGYSVTRISKNDGKDYKVRRISTESGFAHKVLGIETDRLLTEEEIQKAADIISANCDLQDSLYFFAEVHNPPSETAIMEALKNYDLEQNIPFSTTDVDSMLAAKGYEAEVSLVRTDSIVWHSDFERHNSLLSPEIRFSAPYSELENRSVNILIHIPQSRIIGNMAVTLVSACAISFLLIICLIYQFSTIIKLDRLDKMRREFTSTMIHELKRPVATLKMCVSGMANEKMMSTPGFREKLTEQTRRALDTLSACFSKMRDLTFNNVEQIPLNCCHVGAAQLFDGCASRVPVPQGKSVTFVNAIDRELQIYADPTHLANIFINLIAIVR